MVSQWHSSGIFSMDSPQCRSATKSKSSCPKWAIHHNSKHELSSCRCSMTSYGDLKTMNGNVILTPTLCLYLQKIPTRCGEGHGPASGLSCSSRLIFFLKWELWIILFSAEAILASSTSKSGIEIPRVDDEDLNSSTESTNSTSLIHCIASVGNCEQVHTSVLNLIFQQANVAGVGNLSK